MAPRDIDRDSKRFEKLTSPYMHSEVHRTPDENVVPEDLDQNATVFLQILADSIWPPFYEHYHPMPHQLQFHFLDNMMLALLDDGEETVSDEDNQNQ